MGCREEWEVKPVGVVLWEFVEERVDLWMSSVFSFFPFSDGEAGVRKTAVSMIVWSVKDPRKDFL